MLKFDPRSGIITKTTGGYLDAGLPIQDTFVQIGMGMGGKLRCVFYEPVTPVEKSKIGVVVIHSDEDYSTFNIGGELAKRGYRTLCGQVSDPGATLDQKMLDIKKAVQFLKAYEGIEKVVLMGHSGGATLMSAYQAAAEKGISAYKAAHMLYKSQLSEELIPADAMLILDSNWGNGAMTLFSVDPAVIEEGNGIKLDPELDMFNPRNGFDPQGCEYSKEFLDRFFAAQRDRNNAIIKHALDRLTLIEQGKGNYNDDEPFCPTATGQIKPMNKLINVDISLFSHTKEAHTLLHKDGSATTEIVRCLRTPAGMGGHSPTPSVRAASITTVRSYLSNRAVIAGENYRMNPDGAVDIHWDDTYDCTSGNVKNINAPMLIMGMTGSYEYLAAEGIFNNSASRDKTLMFMEGAGHNFDTRGPEAEKYGDTQKVVFDTCDTWLQGHVL